MRIDVSSTLFFLLNPFVGPFVLRTSQQAKRSV
jgi:hypothetical protein